MRPTRMIGLLESVQQHETHLQQDLELLRDLVGLALVEGLGAVAALSRNAPACASARRSRSCSISHEATSGGSATERPRRVSSCSEVRIARLLSSGAGGPARWMPGGSVGGTHGGKYSNSAGYGTLPPITRYSCTKFSFWAPARSAPSSVACWRSRAIMTCTLADVDAAAAEAVVQAHGSRSLRAVALDASDAKALENTSRSTSRTPSSRACRSTAIRPSPRPRARATRITSI